MLVYLFNNKLKTISYGCLLLLVKFDPSSAVHDPVIRPSKLMRDFYYKKYWKILHLYPILSTQYDSPIKLFLFLKLALLKLIQRMIFPRPVSSGSNNVPRTGGKLRLFNDVSLSKVMKNASVNSFLLILCSFYKHFTQTSSRIGV